MPFLRLKRRLRLSGSALFGSILLTLSLTGCFFTAFSEVAKTAVGGYSDFYIVSEPGVIPPYDSILFTPVQSMIGNAAGREVVRITNESISNELRTHNFRQSGRAPLYLDGFIIHTDDGFMSKDIVVRLRLMDATTWEIVREANVVGKAEGANSLLEAARAIGPAVVKLLDQTRSAQMPVRNTSTGSGGSQSGDSTQYRRDIIITPGGG